MALFILNCIYIIMMNDPDLPRHIHAVQPQPRIVGNWAGHWQEVDGGNQRRWNY